MTLTKRGKRVRATAYVILGVSLLVAICLVATHLWATPSGWCWGTADVCLWGGL